MKVNKTNSELKTSRGYRLKNSTHMLIERIQKIIICSKDSVISNSVRLYYEKWILDINKSNQIIKLSKKIKTIKKIKPNQKWKH